MKLSKRVLALATAGVMALVVAGLFGSGHITPAMAFTNGACYVPPFTTPTPNIPVNTAFVCDYTTTSAILPGTFPLGGVQFQVTAPAGTVFSSAPILSPLMVANGCTATGPFPSAILTINCAPLTVTPAGQAIEFNLTSGPTSGAVVITAQYFGSVVGPPVVTTGAAVCPPANEVGGHCDFVENTTTALTPTALGNATLDIHVIHSGTVYVHVVASALPPGCTVTNNDSTDVTITCAAGTPGMLLGTGILETMHESGCTVPDCFAMTKVYTNPGALSSPVGTALISGVIGAFAGPGAAQNVQMGLGCTSSNTANPGTDITFAVNANGSLNPSQVTPAFPYGLSIFQTNGVVFCDVVLMDNDALPLTVPGGNIAYLVRGPAQIMGGGISGSGLPGTGILFGGQFNQGGLSTYTQACGALTTGLGIDGCQGAVPAATAFTNATAPVACSATAPIIAACLVNPNQSNGVYIGLLQGSTFPFIGGSGALVEVSATYTESPTLGTLVLSAGPLQIPFIEPSYQLTVVANPTSIPAGTTTPIPATVAGAGTPVTSAITTALFHNAYPLCASLPGSPYYVCPTANTGSIFGNVINGTGGTTTPNVVTFGPSLSSPYVAGAEPGVVTDTTSLGYFPNAQQSQSAGQVISLHCGAAGGTSPFLLTPQIGAFNPAGGSTQLNALQSQCISVTANLAAGGQVGTANIFSTFIGDYTGASAVAGTNWYTTVQFTAGSPSDVLNNGCNEVITGPSLAGNANSAAVLALVSGGFRVLSLWQYNNALHAFQALYFSTAGAPTDISSVGPNQSIFICGTGSGTFTVA